MKAITTCISAAILLIATSCGQHKTEANTEAKRDSVPAGRQFQKPANPFAGIEFASKKDTSCGMPLSAGLEDTVTYNGKVYGFCSKECKDEFVTKLQKEHKR